MAVYFVAFLFGNDFAEEFPEVADVFFELVFHGCWGTFRIRMNRTAVVINSGQFFMV